MYRMSVYFLLAGMLLLPASVAGQQTDPSVTIHVVQRGENLYRIALLYGLTVQELASLNGITDPSNIQVGQRLLVPTGETENDVVPQTHVVQPGETLRSIAELYGLSVEMLASQNEIVDSNTIYVGQLLRLIPDAIPTQATESLEADVVPIATGANLIHIVQSGETLFRIATSYGLTVNDLAQANNISDPTVIFTGQQLIIPGVESSDIALDLPSSVSRLEVSPLIFVEGKTGRVHLSTSVPMNVSGTFLDRGVAVGSDQSNMVHTILTGVPIFTETGIYPFLLSMVDGAGQLTDMVLNIQIVTGNYGSEYINLLADRANLLDPNVEASEQSLIAGMMSTFTPTRYWDGVMGLPAAAPIISPFGRRRSFDGGPFNHFHSGTDFGGAPGAPILVAASGYVVFAGTVNVRGNATIIDHGWGVFTGYWHQSEQYVQVGDFVTAGQVIGAVGSTGRVTGPHLHWELWVDGVPVDPMQWVQQSFL